MDTPTFEQLPSYVASLMKEVREVKELLSSQNKNSEPKPDKLVLLPQAAEILGIAETTVYSKVSRGELPYMKRGKKLYFSEKELREYLMQGKVKTAAEIAMEAGVYLSTHK